MLVGLGCHNKVDIQPTPLPRPSCLVTKAIYKTGHKYRSNDEMEQVIVNGRKYAVYLQEERYYTYNAKGNLIRELQKTPLSSSEIKYTYSSSQIWRQTVNTNNGIITQNILDTIRLNSQGFDDNFIYNEQGLMLTYKSWAKTATVKVETHNQVYHSAPYQGLGQLINEWIFDINRKSVPQIYQFLGVGNQNLISSVTTVAKGIPFVTNGLVYHVDYNYEFDTFGRVKHETQVDTDYPDSSWPFIVNPGGIGIIYYDYECH